MSASHVVMVRDLLDVLREGHTVYSQAAQRTRGAAEARAVFEHRGEVKRLQVQQFVAWCKRHPNAAERPLTLDACVHRAHAHLHSMLQLRPDESLMDEMEHAERALFGAFRTAAALTSGEAQRELSGFLLGAVQAHTMQTRSTGANRSAGADAGANRRGAMGP